MIYVTAIIHKLFVTFLAGQEYLVQNQMKGKLIVIVFVGICMYIRVCAYDSYTAL